MSEESLGSRDPPAYPARMDLTVREDPRETVGSPGRQAGTATWDAVDHPDRPVLPAPW